MRVWYKYSFHADAHSHSIGLLGYELSLDIMSWMVIRQLRNGAIFEYNKLH